MDRVWALNASSTPPTLPASLETGYPKSSGAFTSPGYWWYYMVTETLLNPITAAGLTPNRNAQDQLTQAITLLAKQNSVSGALLPVRLVDTAGVALTGLQTVDGVAAAAGDRVLRAVGTDPTNGPWVVNSAGAWTRPSDWADAAVIPEGMLISVSEGSGSAKTVWTLGATATKTDTVDTTAVSFVNITAQLQGTLANYLTISQAASQYLTQSAASTTYATLANISGFITGATADSLYLRKTDAQNTYATINSLNSVNAQFSSYYTGAQSDARYLQASALSPYYTVSQNDSRYESQSQADSRYSYLTNTPQVSGLGVGTSWPGGSGGYIYATGNLIAGYSDDRLKTRLDDLAGIKDALAIVRELSGFLYRPNDLGLSLGLQDEVEAGVSAQTTRRVYPWAVARSPVQAKDDPQGDEELLTVRYERFAPLLINAVNQIDGKLEKVIGDVERLVRSLRKQ